MRSLLSLLCLASAARAMFFFVDSQTKKCFYEDLPKDTLVVGYFRAEEYNEQSNEWQQHQGINIYISVDELFDNDHRVVSQLGSSSGRFTFSAAEAGVHKICFTPSSSSGRSSWLSSKNPNGGIKVNLDLVIGETNEIESSDKDTMESLATRVKGLNARLTDIRKEQVFQREREADFRDQSESTNSRVIRWMIIQLVILGATCAWQLSHLRSFFIKQKLT